MKNTDCRFLCNKETEPLRIQMQYGDPELCIWVPWTMTTANVYDKTFGKDECCVDIVGADTELEFLEDKIFMTPTGKTLEYNGISYPVCKFSKLFLGKICGDEETAKIRITSWTWKKNNGIEFRYL